jgi:PD-(D/E)XK endonuclease
MANCNGPRKCKGFRTFKERGEWVELQFMAWVLRKGLKVTKPWGDSSSYDVGVEHGRQFLRVQVKSTSYRLANGYLCGFRPNQRRKTLRPTQSRFLRRLHRPRRSLVRHPRRRRPKNQKFRPDALPRAAHAP